MTREEVRDEILKIESPDILCELPTSFGKTRIALDVLRKKFPAMKHLLNAKILIVVPRLVLIDNWKDEFKKWKCASYLPFITFVTYVSFPKKIGNWDFVIFDEVHHLSERCRNALSEGVTVKSSIMLSATVGYKLKGILLETFPRLYPYKVSTKKAIQEEILPDPKVYLIPLTLDNNTINYEIIKNKNQKEEIIISYSQRFNYTKVKNKKIIIKCTQKQYYDDMSSLIQWYKRKSYMSTFKNLFLKKSGDRLKWLSDQKSWYVLSILNYFQDERTLTFCNSISQTEQLGKYCVNSKNKKSDENLQKFNEGKINHITACSMLDEGINLVNCKIGIYAMLNSSERMIKQRLGRLLRHPEPIIIIPYYKGTREEDIVRKMLEDYNSDLIRVASPGDFSIF